MAQYTGNSIASKTPESEKKVKEPVTNNVKVSTPLFKKFFAQDIRQAGLGVTNDVLIPGLKGLIVNLLKKSVDYIFLGGSSNTNSGYNGNYVNYSAPRNITYAPGYTPPNNNLPQAPTNKASIYMVNDIVFNERGEAEETLSRLNEIISMYGMASVQDFYDLIEYKGNSYTDNKYGWKSLSSATVDRCYEGYKIKFPKVIPLE